MEDLISEVRNQIRDNGATEVFTDAELTDFINDAVFQFSRYRPRKRPYVLQLVQTQSDYTLPDDWMKVDAKSFNEAIHPKPSVGLYGVYAYEFNTMMMTPANIGLINIKWEFYDDDLLLTATPAPLSNYTLNFNYMAYHQVTSNAAPSPIPCTIPKQNQATAMYWASSQALQALVIDQTKLGKYRLGSSTSSGIEVDNSETIQILNKMSDNFMTQWKNEIMNRPRGARAGDLSGMIEETIFGSVGVYGANW